MDILQKAKALEKELIKDRRYLHSHAETGFHLRDTAAYVQKRLQEMGYTPEIYGKGAVVATLGRGRKNFLLRADMDALPIKEETGETFACKNGKMHACGHDMHTTMLLGAASLLKSRERQLSGKVTLLFQPAEEILEGAKNAIEAGVLKDCKAQAAMMLHVMTGVSFPAGTVIVASEGVSAPAADYFTIRVQGKGCHGSMPWKGKDALTVAARILLGLQEISARELALSQPAVLTVGALKTGEAGNAISDIAELYGTLRAFDEETRAYIKKRVQAIARGIAKAFDATVSVRFPSGCPTLVNDGELSSFAFEKLKELCGEKSVFTSSQLQGEGKKNGGGSEDFAYISHEVPSVMLAIAAGETGAGYRYPLHHPKAKFDESALCVGAAAYAHIAEEWLKREK